MGIDMVMRSAGFEASLSMDRTECYSKECTVRDIRCAFVQPLKGMRFQSVDDAVIALFYDAKDTLVFSRMFDSVMDFLDCELAWVEPPSSDAVVT